MIDGVFGGAVKQLQVAKSSGHFHGLSVLSDIDADSIKHNGQQIQFSGFLDVLLESEGTTVQLGFDAKLDRLGIRKRKD